MIDLLLEQMAWKPLSCVQSVWELAVNHSIVIAEMSGGFHGLWYLPRYVHIKPDSIMCDIRVLYQEFMGFYCMTSIWRCRMKKVPLYIISKWWRYFHSTKYQLLYLFSFIVHRLLSRVAECPWHEKNISQPDSTF